MAKIPEKIHFVWIGGPIPEDYLKQILALAKIAKDSNFEFNVWCDNKDNFLKQLQKQIKTADLPDEVTNLLGVNLRNIDELQSKMKDDPFYQEENRLRDYNYNLNRERIGNKNLAAASDFLRYEILRQEGGFYFDTDTLFLISKNAKLKTVNAPLGIVANVRIINEDDEDLVTGNNDIIGCTPNHPVMRGAIKQSIENYKELDASKVYEQHLTKIGEILNYIKAQNDNLNKLEKLKETYSHQGKSIVKVEEKIQAIQEAILTAKKLHAEVKTSATKYKKFYEKMANHKTHTRATEMDMKRYPYARHVKKTIESKRFSHTLNASGPHMLNRILTRFIKHNKSKGDANSVAFNFKLGNVIVKPNTDSTWLPKNKPESFKGMSFDDTAIPQSFFSKRKTKTKKEETSTHSKKPGRGKVEV